MNIAAFAGWTVVIFSIASILNKQRSRAARQEVLRPAEKEGAEPIASQSWCRAMERVASGSVLLLDASLHLIAAGDQGEELCGKGERGNHLVDLVPEEAAASLIEAAALARRNGFHAGTSRWGEDERAFSFLLIGDAMLLGIAEPQRMKEELFV